MKRQATPRIAASVAGPPSLAIDFVFIDSSQLSTTKVANVKVADT
jgi:hypothetical protein